MWHRPENDQYVDEILLAGDRVSAGVYRRLGSSQIVRLETEDYLPASLDGRVACYLPVASQQEKLGPSDKRLAA